MLSKYRSLLEPHVIKGVCNEHLRKLPREGLVIL